MNELYFPRNRISIQGFGETKPVHSNDSEEGKALNRRIELVIDRDISEVPELIDLLK